LEKELDTTKELLEESEDMTYDLQNTCAKQKRAGALQHLQLVTSQLRAVSVRTKALERADQKWEEEVERIEATHEQKIKEMQATIEDLKEEINQHETTRHAMHDTLVNHKRALLMEHKVQSTVLQSDLQSLLEQKEDVEKEHVSAMKELAHLEGAVKEVERQMRDLGQVSAIQDGRVNVAHAKKKRRLDQEFETLLEKASEKKDHLSRVSSRLQEIDEAIKDKEDEMKDLERHLVELLVDQQKRLLSVLKDSAGDKGKGNNANAKKGKNHGGKVPKLNLRANAGKR